jgi:hypothetical protein
MACYEKAYYLNLGRYGAKNINTEYFKLKIEIFNDMVRNYNSGSVTNSNTININSSEHQTPTKEIKEVSNFLNLRNNFNATSNNLISQSQIGNNHIPSTNLPTSSLYRPDTELERSGLDVKGFSQTFKFQIAYSNSSEPLIISIYDLQTNIHNENIFIKNLYFDKNHLCKLFKINPLNTAELYNENNILRLINSIILVNGKISLLDDNLKMGLLNTIGVGGVRPISGKNNVKVPYLLNKK